MTVGRAIAILDATTRERTLAIYDYYGGFNGKRHMEEAFSEACALACEIMKEWTIEHSDCSFEKEYKCLWNKESGENNEQ